MPWKILRAIRGGALATDFAVASLHVPLAADRQVMTVTPVLDPAERLTMAQQVKLPEVLARCAADTGGQLLGWTYRVVSDVGDHLTFDVAHKTGSSAPERDKLRIACRAMLGLPATAWLGTEPDRQQPNRDPRENA